MIYVHLLQKMPGPAIKHQNFYIHKSMALHHELPSDTILKWFFQNTSLTEEIPNPNHLGCKKKCVNHGIATTNLNWLAGFLASTVGTQVVGLLDATHELIFYEGTHLGEMICCLFVHLCEWKKIKNHHLYQHRYKNPNSKYQW